MQNNHSQSGSAHVIVIILLILALLGALGFVFYQNFIVKQASDTQTTNDQSSEDKPEIVTSRLAFNNDIYALDHPKNWAVNIKKPTSAEDLDTTRTLTIAGPEKTVEVKVVIAEGGLGGACDTNDGLKLRYYNVRQKAVTKLTKEPLYLVEAMTDYLGGGYKYIIGLSPEGGETHASLGDSHCTVQYVGVASKVIIDPVTDTITQPTIIATIHFPKLPEATQQKVKSIDEITAIFATDEYQTAVTILESARKE